MQAVSRHPARLPFPLHLPCFRSIAAPVVKDAISKCSYKNRRW